MYKSIVAVVFSFYLFSLNAEEFICSQPVVSLHKEPRVLSEVVSQLIWSNQVEVIESHKNGWVRVLRDDGTTGWLLPSTLTTLEGGIYPDPDRAATVTSRTAHVYLVRDVRTYPPLLSLPFGSKVETLHSLDVQAERWVEVRLINGEVGYMLRSDLTRIDRPLAVDEILEVAKSFVGTPFTWGGQSAYGYDAAGFVQMLYGLAGVNMPHDAALQAADSSTRDVPFKALVAGDLVFFSQRDDGVIDHVGIYLGDNEFIHASHRNTPPSVQISALDALFWQASFKKCRHLGP